MSKYTLLSEGSTNAKLAKSDSKFGQTLNFILYLAPAELAFQAVGRKGTLCPFADKAGCKAACLNTAGRGAFNNVQSARLRKAVRFIEDRDGFMADLYADLEKVASGAERKGVQAVVRLNGTSDIVWENIKDSEGRNVFEAFPMVQFYDYTKIAKRVLRDLPSNYHLTLSYSQHNMDYAAAVKRAAWASKAPVAVVFRKELPESFLGLPVINGDEHDQRFRDRGVIVGLTAKGSAKRDQSGFVVG